MQQFNRHPLSKKTPNNQSPNLTPVKVHCLASLETVPPAPRSSRPLRLSKKIDDLVLGLVFLTPDSYNFQQIGTFSTVSLVYKYMKTILTGTVLFAALLFPAIGETTNRVALITQEVAICEAVFLYQIPHTMSHADTNALYVLSIKGNDPDVMLLKRFTNHHPPLRRKSEVPPEQEHLTTTLFIDEIRWIDAAHVRVTGGYTEPGNNVAKDRYFLERREGSWLVTKQERILRAGG